MVVLILLIVVTLLGLVALRGTLMEERMSAYQFDRSLAFQAAESALRLAEQKVQEAAVAGQSIGVDCSPTRATCSATPPGMDTASPEKCEANTPGCWITVASTGNDSDDPASTPQYYIEYMGDVLVSDEPDSGRSASANQEGGTQPTYGKSIYRISARSQDPRENRALVALQATIELR
jgi:type IV pilus assembly protein PilX